MAEWGAFFNRSRAAAALCASRGARQADAGGRAGLLAGLWAGLWAGRIGLSCKARLLCIRPLKPP